MGAIFRWVKELWLGRRALGQTTERAAATMTGVTYSLFTVSGGRILVTQILGEVEVAPVGVLTISLQADPTDGTTRALCAGLLVTAYVIGDLLGITGVTTDPMIPAATGGAIEAQTQGVIVQEGTIDLLNDILDAGSIKWTLKWIPIDAGAAVVAAA
ncbi:hypothetical protein ES703_114940 [subsurface metagenome]